MLLIMAGGTLSATGSFRGSVTVPQGLNFVVGDVLGPTGFLSTPTDAFNTEVHINRFYMDFYDSGEVNVDFVLTSVKSYTEGKNVITTLLVMHQNLNLIKAFLEIFYKQSFISIFYDYIFRWDPPLSL
jgi:hypothetical protein